MAAYNRHKYSSLKALQWQALPVIRALDTRTYNTFKLGRFVDYQQISHLNRNTPVHLSY